MSQSYKSLLLSKGYEEKIRQGYPWIFSGNLISSVKEVLPGELVEIKDHKGKFLARGYCHPKANLSIRVLSRDNSEKDLLTKDFFLRRLQRAWDERKKNWDAPSFRWLFSDSDFVPGLVLDLFTIESADSTEQLRTEEILLVSQVSTLGMQNAMVEFEAALHEWAAAHWTPQNIQWSWIEANVSNARKLEGLVVEKPVWRFGKVRDWNHVKTQFKNQNGVVSLSVDFMDGQKTGFFLDQQANVQALMDILKSSNDFMKLESVKVLDLFCYVGQWGTHLAKFGKDIGKPMHIHFADVSEKALSLAKENASAFSEDVEVFEQDLMREIWEFTEDQYDVVICDPPAFVKKREDLRNAEEAYVGVFSDAMKFVKPGGFLVVSSCSGLVRRDMFTRIVDKATKETAASQSNGTTPAWAWKKFSHGPDHPLRSWFPEGEYLKCWIGQRS